MPFQFGNHIIVRAFIKENLNAVFMGVDNDFSVVKGNVFGRHTIKHLELCYTLLGGSDAGIVVFR